MIPRRTTPCLLAAFLAAVAAGPAGAQKIKYGPGAARLTNEPVTAEADVVKLVKHALDIGEAFEPRFMVLDEELPDEQKAALRQRNTAMMEALREDFRFDTEWRFVLGRRFEIRDTNQAVVQFTVTMPGETDEAPSLFRLRSSQPEQAYLVFEAKDRRGIPHRAHLLVWPVESAWRAADFAVFPARMGEMDFEAAIKTARKELEAGRPFVAAAMLAVAERLGGSPAYRTPGRVAQLGPVRAKLEETLGLGKRPVGTVAGPDGPVEIQTVGGMPYVEGLFAVVAIRGQWKGSARATALYNKQVARAVLKAHAGFRTHFKGLGIVAFFADGDRPPFRSAHLLAELDAPDPDKVEDREGTSPEGE